MHNVAASTGVLEPTVPDRRDGENRRFQRVRVNLFGRYMLPDRVERNCQITDMSPGGMALAAPVCGRIGERVVVYADQVGRLEGIITREMPGGFAATILAVPGKREKFAAQLTWLANRHLLYDLDARRDGRVVPRDPHSALTLPSGTQIACTILNISMYGAAITASNPLPIGMLTMLGRVQSRVVRHIDCGFVVEFTRTWDRASLEENIAAPCRIIRLHGSEV